MLLLVDIGNTHTHVGLAAGRRLRPLGDIPTADWSGPAASRRLRRLVGRAPVRAASVCSVVPSAMPRVRDAVESFWHMRAWEHAARSDSAPGLPA